MATIITEIYVSVDGLEYTKLDLYKDESFTMKYSKKDLQDITKVFAPFSQNFTFPATPKNKQALGFFGNVEVLKSTSDNKYFCKVYTNGQINHTGLLKIESVKYKNNKADSFTGNFNTNMLSLKDRIANDTLNDLTDLDFQVNWKPNNVFNRIKGTDILSNSGVDVKYYVPLISNNRVWNYNSSEPGNDNIAYKSTSNPRTDKVVNIGELRPAISFISLLSLIKNKYNLSITTPLEDRDELKDAYIWCTGENFTLSTYKKFIYKTQFSNESPSLHGISVVNFTDSSIKITKDPAVSFIQFRLTLIDLVVGDNKEKANASISIVNKATGLEVLNFEFEVDNDNEQMAMNIPMYLFVSNEFEFYTYIKFSKPAFWRYSTARVLYRRGSSDKVSTFTNNFNSDDTASYYIDLIQSLPNMKVIDFLTSYLKSFNISIFDSSPSDDNLYFLTPQDVNTTGFPYSKSQVDYTKYCDVKEVPKSRGNDYNYYNLKLKSSKYRSNVDFKKQFGIEYGQTSYPSIKPDKANEFKVEVDFAIIPPVLLNGSNQVWTAYGFTSEAPEVDDDGFFRYAPNTNELTIFYNHGNVEITDSLGCQNINTSDVLVCSPLTSYIKSMPFCKSNNNTFSFSILVIDGVEYENTLFSLYYSNLISSLLNPNVLTHSFNLKLPSSEIYLNDANVSAGSGLTSKGFRLQNEVIIGETKFDIVDASIDETTGKTKLTLLNIQ